jgi:uncharacterized protein YkwD
MASLRARRSVVRVLVAASVGVAAAGAATLVAGLGDFGSVLHPPPVAIANADSMMENEVVDLANEERAKAGCQPLTKDPRLAQAAEAHSKDMAERDYLDHTTPEGLTFRDRIRNAGFTNPGVGENIARGPLNAAQVMRSWMASPDHRVNILDCDFSVIGVGLDRNGMYWAQDFGAS